MSGMVTRNDIQAMIADLGDGGVTVTPREVALVMLCHVMDCSEIAYALLYGGTAEDMDNLFSSPEYAAVDAYYSRTFGEDGMSYDEVKRSLEQSIRDIDDLLRDPKVTLDPKDVAALTGRSADMKVKLVDKFGTSQKSEEHKIVVLNKFNDICPWCGREISVMKNARTGEDDDKRIPAGNKETPFQSGTAFNDKAVHPGRGAGISSRKVRGRSRGTDQG